MTAAAVLLLPACVHGSRSSSSSSSSRSSSDTGAHYSGFACTPDAHTDTSTAEFALLEHGARCPAPLKLDPCLTLVALAVWHHCRLRLWPARGGQQHACKGVAFKGIVSGNNTASGTLRAPGLSGPPLPPQPASVKFDAEAGRLRLSFRSCRLTYAPLGPGPAVPPPGDDDSSEGAAAGADRTPHVLQLFAIAAVAPFMLGGAALLALAPNSVGLGRKRSARSSDEDSDVEGGRRSRDQWPRGGSEEERRPLMQGLGSCGGSCDNAGGAGASGGGVGRWSPGHSIAVDALDVSALEARRQKRRSRRKQQQQWMAEAVSCEGLRGGSLLSALLPSERQGGGGGCGGGGGGDSGWARRGASAADAPFAPEVDADGCDFAGASAPPLLVGSTPLVDSGFAALLAVRRARELRRKLRRPLFVGRSGGARAFAEYRRGRVAGGGAGAGVWLIARMFRFAPAARPPQLPAIKEAEGEETPVTGEGCGHAQWAPTAGSMPAGCTLQLEPLGRPEQACSSAPTKRTAPTITVVVDGRGGSASACEPWPL